LNVDIHIKVNIESWKLYVVYSISSIIFMLLYFRVVTPEVWSPRCVESVHYHTLQI
jgi:hypothetical protein